MAESVEFQLVSKLLEKTQQSQVTWQRTAVPGEVTASFAGKFTIILRSIAHLISPGSRTISMIVKNADGDELADVKIGQDKRLEALYELAVRRVRKVDEQIAELIQELDQQSPEPTRIEKARLIQKIRESKAGESENK